MPGTKIFFSYRHGRGLAAGLKVKKRKGFLRPTVRTLTVELKAGVSPRLGYLHPRSAGKGGVKKRLPLFLKNKIRRGYGKYRLGKKIRGLGSFK